MTRTRKIKKTLLALVLLLVASLPFSAGWITNSIVRSSQEGGIAGISPRPVQVRRGDVVSRLALRGVLIPRTSQEIRSPTGGTVVAVLVRVGEVVDSGRILLRIRGDQRTSNVRAPVQGNLVELAVDPGSPVQAGGHLGLFESDATAVSAALAPALLYRLPSAGPRSIIAQITDGPGPFPCRFLSFRREGAFNQIASDESPAQYRLHCAVPKSVRAVIGAAVVLDVITASARDVLYLPRSAVSGIRGSASVVRLSGAAEVATRVKTGIVSENRVEIIEGLEEGDTVLDRFPSRTDT